MDKQVDVVVVGPGPVGLLLAIELKLGGAGKRNRVLLNFDAAGQSNFIWKKGVFF